MGGQRKANEIYINRVYNAPVSLVWEAWTDPKQAAKWWGPRGFTLTTHSKELKPGGKWIYTMHGPDGTDYPNIATYHEVEKHALLVYDHGATPTTPPLFRVTVRFSEKNKKTTMEMTMTLASAEAAEEIKKFIKQAGGNSTWDRLGEYLAEKDGLDHFIINRTFEAPVDVVYEMWTNPKHIAKWMPPTGATMEFISADIRPGGKSFYRMDGPFGRLHGCAQYHEFERPHRITYSQQFCDENQKVCRHPMAPTWPESMRTTVEFTPEGDNLTRVTVTWVVEGAAGSEERETFHKGKAGMTQGWTGSFDKLEELLGGLSS
ncbi:MAG: SRPBCC family protein [Bdellovibrionales bacterium]